MRLLLIVSALARLNGLSVESDSDDIKPVTYTWHSDVKPLVSKLLHPLSYQAISVSGDFNDQDTVFALADLMLALRGSIPFTIKADLSRTR